MTTSPASARRLGLALLAALAACSDKPTAPPTPSVVTAVVPASFASVAGSAVAGASLPSVKVTTARGTAVPGVTVLFAVTGGGGSIPTGSGSAVTDAAGIATVASWTLGATAGTNIMTATATGLSPVTFTATGTAGPAAKLAVITAPSATAANRAAFPVQPVMQIQDANSNLITTSTAPVTAAITAGGGTLQGTVTVAAVNGVATFTDLSIAGTAGPRTLSFSATGLTAVTGQVTTTAGAAASIAANGGNNQTALAGTAVSIAPSVIINDADGNPVAGTAVSYAVTDGGGSITGANAVSGADGIATAGSWTLGPAQGVNTLTATATGLTGSPVTFTATGATALVQVTAVSPAVLTPGITATITGTGFHATPANNTVMIDGVAVTVGSATATTLSVTLPSVLPCAPAHDAVVSVTVGGNTGTKDHPIQAATQLALTPGQSVVLATAAEARCNELSHTGGLYYLSVYNTNTTYSTTGAPFELRGAPGAAALTAAHDNVVVPPRPAARQAPRRATPEDAADLAHLNLLERDLQFLRQNGRQWRQGATRASAVAVGGTRALAVGDAMQVRLRDIRTTSCNAYLEITGRVAYMGTKSIIVEDNANPLAGTIDTTYAQIGEEFDTVMWPILEANFGNPIANDAVLDNNGRIVMVFTTKVNDLFTGIAGFVSPCDFFQRTTYTSSNVGEYFYAMAPTVAGDINVINSPPRWRWSMRGTIIHEVKHIVSTGERFSRNNGSVFEESWLEETTARLSEELYERARYGFAQRTNIGYGSAGNPVGPYCGVRLVCGQARGIIRVFEELSTRWYAAPHDYSPLGRVDASDFSFYATGWSLLRWALDASAGAEATMLKNMTQEPTRTGLANFEHNTGTTLAAALPKWTMAMVLDDHPGFTPADATLRQPSWNFRNVFSGYDTDFNVPWVNWPLVPLANTFGAFSRTASVRPGTSAIIQLSGTQAAKQLLELKANGAAAAAPAELRMIIVRVQ